MNTSQLLNQAQKLIEIYGPDAPIAYFIMTPGDVVSYDDDGNEVEETIEVATKVLNELQEDDYIFETLNNTLSGILDVQ